MYRREHDLAPRHRQGIQNITHNSTFRLHVAAEDIDLHLDLAHIEVSTAASGVQKASHKKATCKDISAFIV